jgi:hypothetical protein
LRKTWPFFKISIVLWQCFFFTKFVALELEKSVGPEFFPGTCDKLWPISGHGSLFWDLILCQNCINSVSFGPLKFTDPGLEKLYNSPTKLAPINKSLQIFHRPQPGWPPKPKLIISIQIKTKKKYIFQWTIFRVKNYDFMCMFFDDNLWCQTVITINYKTKFNL